MPLAASSRVRTIASTSRRCGKGLGSFRLAPWGSQTGPAKNAPDHHCPHGSRAQAGQSFPPGKQALATPGLSAGLSHHGVIWRRAGITALSSLIVLGSKLATRSQSQERHSPLDGAERGAQVHMAIIEGFYLWPRDARTIRLDALSAPGTRNSRRSRQAAVPLEKSQVQTAMPARVAFVPGSFAEPGRGSHQGHSRGHSMPSNVRRVEPSNVRRMEKVGSGAMRCAHAVWRTLLGR